jgi:prevent-host-death family protein
MQKVSVTDFKNRLQSYLIRVEAGEEIVLLSRGKPVARMLPVTDQPRLAKGQLKTLRKRCRVDDVTSPINEPWEVDK